MSRVKRGTKAKHRRKKILDRAKGFRGRSKNTIRAAAERVARAEQFSTRDRRVKKRDMRSLWIIRVGIAAKQNGLSYSKFIDGLKKANVELNRKVLAELAVNSPKAFSEIVQIAKAKLAA